MARAVQAEAAGGVSETRTRPIDLVFLARQTLGDPGLEAEILMMFDQMSSAYLARVHAAATPEDVSISLHSLKGAARGIGAAGIAAHAKDAEDEFEVSGRIEAETLSDLSIAVTEVSTFISGLLER